jgi:sulfite exporter TauE/SafE
MIATLAGFLAEFIHVLAGPDHLAAIAPLAAKHPRNSWIAGLRWGVGHASGVCLVGIMTLLLRGLIPVELVSKSGDRLVGVMLIAIGAWALRKGLHIHAHEHAHGGHCHEHIHLHGPSKPRPHEHAHMHAALAIGTLHGLAGSSHILGILPMLALPSPAAAAAYLLAFAIGTVAGMVGFAQAIGSIASLLQLRSWKIYRGLMFACSAVAFVTGAICLAGFSL